MSFTYYLCPWRQSLEECLSAQRTCGFVAWCEPFILWNEKKWKQAVSEEREAFEIIQDCTFCWFWNICRIGVINGDGLRTSLWMENYIFKSALVTFYRILNLWFERDAIVLPIKNIKTQHEIKILILLLNILFHINTSDYRSKMSAMLTLNCRYYRWWCKITFKSSKVHFLLSKNLNLKITMMEEQMIVHVALTRQAEWNFFLQVRQAFFGSE